MLRISEQMKHVRHVLRCIQSVEHLSNTITETYWRTPNIMSVSSGTRKESHNDMLVRSIWRWRSDRIVAVTSFDARSRGV